MRNLVNRVIKPLAIWIARKSSVADTVLKAIIRLIQAMSFATARLREREDPKTVLFFSFMGKKFADSPRAIFEAMIADPQFADWTFVWAFRGYDGTEFTKSFATHDRVSVVTYNSRGFFEALARAKYWVTNSHVTDGVMPPPSKVYLQTWHGTPLKRMGADIPTEGSKMPKKTRNYGSWYQLQASKWTYLTSQSPYFTEKISAAFRIGALRNPPTILDSGLPRNSKLFANTPELAVHAEEIRSRLGIAAGKKIALYAPTFRDNQHSSAIGYTYNLGVDFQKLRRELGNDWVVLFRAHYFVANSLNFDEFEGFVYDVSAFDDINDLFVAADVLVTDYSSSMVDFANTLKPILIYAYDLDEYGNELRGFYIPITEFPGPVFTTQDELAESLNALDRIAAEWADRRDEFRKTYTPWDSAGSTQRVIDAVFRSLETSGSGPISSSPTPRVN